MVAMRLIHGDCMNWNTKCDCIFLDPPDNIGLKYEGFEDRNDFYYSWIRDLVNQSVDLAPIVWLSYNAIHDLPIKNIVQRHVIDREIKTIIWHYTFGQYNDNDFGSLYRPILLIKARGARINVDKIREESVRMRIGDNRAAGLRVPGDVWDFPRVVGNSIERRSWHPTQHCVAIYDRIIKYSVPDGGTFVDYFAGSGTCFRAGLLNPGVNVVGIEISQHYCDMIRKEVKLEGMGK